MNRYRATRWLVATVLIHLVLVLVHGAAHAGAEVTMAVGANLFVFLVIVAGPLAGLLVMRVSRRIGCWTIAATMLGALVFGIVNHFVLISPDHVSHVSTQWRGIFASTAVLLAFSEGIGGVLAIGAAPERRLA